MKNPGSYTFGSLFAGIGGICLGFSQAGFTVKWANEIDKYACQTYRHNEHLINSDLDITEGDIREFHPKESVDVLGGGSPASLIRLRERWAVWMIIADARCSWR